MHLCREDLDVALRAGPRADARQDLYQEGNFAAKETVTLIGPRRRPLPNLRILGPLRKESQIELAVHRRDPARHRRRRCGSRATSTARRARIVDRAEGHRGAAARASSARPSTST